MAEGERISDSSTGSDCRNGRQFSGKDHRTKADYCTFFYKTSGMESAKVLVDLIESKETSSVHKEIKWDVRWYSESLTEIYD